MDFIARWRWWKPRAVWTHEEHQKIMEWLKNSCGKSTGTMYHQLPSLRMEADHAVPLPTRLLDLRPGNRNLRPGWSRLVITRPGDRGHYMTLSHRWGNEHQLKLTKATLNRHRRLFRFRHLPRTYQDAVKVTLSLGYRYLWIDALCIIQDDHEDWLREAAKMALVFRNSSCTISAHAACGDSDGFLCVKNSTSSETSDFRPGVSSLVAASHLSHRGWVFQERILSRRLLHFTAEGLFLEDASGIVTSCGISPEVYDPPKDNKINLEDAHQSPCEWYRFVEKFTVCQFSIDTDRLPAVLGVARYYEEQNDDGHCLWGLWSGSIHQGLLWTSIDENPKRLVRGYDAATGTAPTWSWAHLLCRVRYPDNLTSCEACCEIVNFETATLSARLPAGTSPCLVVRLKAVDVTDIKVTYNPESFMGINFCHQIDYKGICRVTLDGERRCDVVYRQLTLAFVSYNHLTRPLTSYDDEVFTEHSWIYYFFCVPTRTVSRSSIEELDSECFSVLPILRMRTQRSGEVTVLAFYRMRLIGGFFPYVDLNSAKA
jgi:hypothetical protein